MMRISQKKEFVKEIRMEVTFLGQAGLFFRAGGQTVMVDPYFSDSVERINPKNRRRIPVDPSVFALRPDIILITHRHLDHFDPETLSRFVGEGRSPLILAPSGTWEEVRRMGGDANCVLFDRGTEWTEGALHFLATPAVHSDPFAIGAVITFQGERYYVTGDTLYSEEVLRKIPRPIHVLFLPINGVGNNMNAADAARFAAALSPRAVVPLHYGMFDGMDGSELECENRNIMKIYKGEEL